VAVSGPPLGLSVNLTDANGVVTRLGPEDTNPEDIPTGITWRTARDGFGDASMTLSRRIDRDYIDVSLLDEVEIVGADGTTAYEGRIGAAPRSFDGSHSVSLQFAGWISHARDRQFAEIYVDRDLSQWGEIRRARQIAMANASQRYFSPSIANDETTSTPAIRTALSLPWSAISDSTAFYDSGPIARIGAVWYRWEKSTAISAADTNWAWYVATPVQEDLGGGDITANLLAAGPGTGYFTPTASNTYRYAYVRLTYAGAVSGAADFPMFWQLAVYGSHGLTRQGTDPGGFYASDVMRDIASRFCPKLNTNGVQATSFPIPHLVFRDLTYPYDAFLEVNKYHLWDFAVWEDKTLYYQSVDLTDYDWEIRLDDHDYPATVSLQGDSVLDLANGVTVQYQDVTTGQTNILLPTDHTELQDPAVDNPFTTHGYASWKPYQVTVPTTQDAALQLGRAALAEFNQPLAPGSITIGPHVRDRAGHPQQAWKVRAGQRVAITSSTSLSDRPRMISEASYSHDDRKVTISLDGGVKRLDAVVDRLSVALQAAGLGS
jgi:hypothetical protein